VASAAALRAQGEHRRRIALTLALGCPIGTRCLLVGAHGLAHPARLRTVAHQRARIRRALGLAPNGALRQQAGQTRHGSEELPNGARRPLPAGRFAAHTWVAFLSSQVAASHTSQLLGQLLSVNPGFEWHWPADAHPGQSLCVSLHSSRQTPHETGQFFSMKLGFSPHAPADVQTAEQSR
jgi:hypothetical protein